MSEDKFTYSRKPDPEELANIVSDGVNVLGFDEQKFVEAMARAHRTLKQSFTSLCFAWIRECASQDKEGHYDGRNEYSVKKCAEIVSKVEIGPAPFI